MIWWERVAILSFQDRASSLSLNPLPRLGSVDATFLRRSLMSLTLTDEEEVLAWIQTVPPEVYWFERRQQEQREERERWLRRLRDHPSRALAQVDVQFHQLLHNLKR